MERIQLELKAIGTEQREGNALFTEVYCVPSYSL